MYGPVPARLTECVPQGADLVISDATRASLADGVAVETRRAYAGDRRRFHDWCAVAGRGPLPATPETLTEYVGHLARTGLAPNTIQRAVAAIRTEPRAAGLTPPDTTGAVLVLRAYRRARAAEGVREQQSPPLLLSDLQAVVAGCGDELAGVRDRALIVLGWAMMARRSELTGLDISDLDEGEEGLAVLLRWSKTDQDAVGHVVPVPYGSHPGTCPVRLTRAWVAALATRGINAGPLFRPVDRHGRLAGEPGFAGRSTQPRMTGQAVEVILRAAALRAGVAAIWTPHSLRSGGATEARRAGADPLQIARHGRWKDGSAVLYRYIRTIDQWRDNPMQGVGL